MADKTKKEVLLYDGFLSLIGGAVVEIIYPPFALPAMALRVFGAGCVGFCAWTFSKYDKIFKYCNLRTGQAVPILKSEYKTDYNSTIRKFTLPAGLCLQDFLDQQEEIENYIGRQVKISYEDKAIIIEEYEKEMQSHYDYSPTKILGRVPLLIGFDRKEKLTTCDLGDGEPHMLLSGQTGGGKSTALRCMLVNLVLHSDVKLHLIDLKNGVELRLFADCRNTLTFSRSEEQALAALQQIEIEVDRRYDEFYKYKVKDIVEYNKKFRYKKMDYQLLVVDEFADLQNSKKAMGILENLGRKARACGIHMVLSTQRPDAKVITGSIKANIPTVLGLKTGNSTNSRIIIDENGLEKLRGNGHGLFKRNGEITEIQVPYISADDAEKLIKHTYIDKIEKKQIKQEKYKKLEVGRIDTTRPRNNRVRRNKQSRNNNNAM